VTKKPDDPLRDEHPVQPTPDDWTPPERYATAKPLETVTIPLVLDGPFHKIVLLLLDDHSIKMVDFYSKEDICLD
jgi:hypothetical protein